MDSTYDEQYLDYCFAVCYPELATMMTRQEASDRAYRNNKEQQKSQ